MGPAINPPCFYASRVFAFLLVMTSVLGGSRVQAQDVVTEFKGKVKAARGNVLVVTKDDDTEAMVVLNKVPTKLLFSATANPAGLRPGWMVRLEGNFTPQGVATAPVSQFELFLPFQLQAVPGHDRERFTPGIYPVDGEPNKYRVVGQIMGMNQQGVMINAARGQLMVPFAADAKWLIRSHELSLVEPGDPVSVTGFYQPPDDKKVMGDRVTIAVERVIGEATEPARKPARQPRGKAAKPAKPEADAEAEAPAE